MLQTECSPEKKDVISKTFKHGKEEHSIFYQYITDGEIHAAYNKAYPDATISYSAFYDRKPWFVRPGKDNTCLCRYHEQLRLSVKCVQSNGKVLRALSIKTWACEVITFFLRAGKGKGEKGTSSRRRTWSSSTARG
jgi:hypothetical protein